MLNTIKNIFKRELGLSLRDVNIISIIILAPIFYSVFYGSIYINKVERKLPVIVLDEDKTETSKAIIRILDAHQMINIVDSAPDFQSGINKINSCEVYGMVYFMKDFESGLKQNKGATLKTYLNTTRFLISNDLNIAINEVIIDYNSGIKLNFFEKAGYSYEQAKGLTDPVRFEIRSLFNTTESYGDFLVPGIIILIIQQTLLIGLSESIAKEREEGTFGDLYKMSGKNIFALIHGKGLLFGLIYAAFSFFFFTFNYWMFNISLTGSTAALTIFTLILIIAVIYFSIFIASFFKRKIIALQFLTVSTYPIFLISGFSWPLSAMPVWIQYLAKLLPSTPYLSAFVRITKMGAGLTETMPELIHLIILTIFLYILTHIRLKSFLNKQITTTEVTI